MKPPSPLRPKSAPKMPISHPQRRCRFQSHTGTGEQRRQEFQTTGPPGRQGQAAAHANGDDTASSQISHVIYRGHFLRCPKNIAIPTMRIRCLNESSRNYVRNCWLAAIAGHQGNAPSNIREGPTGVEGAGGHGRASRCGAWLRCPWAVAGPGRTTSRRAERSSRRGRLAGGPPPTAQHGPQDSTRGARNTRGPTSSPHHAHSNT